MKVLVATGTNFEVPSPENFNFCIDGELVYLQGMCDSDLRHPDRPGCGCGRAFSGLNSHRATTEARVAETRLSLDDLRDAMESSLRAGGWLEYADDKERMIDDCLAPMLDIAHQHPVGTVLRRRAGTVYSTTAPF